MMMASMIVMRRSNLLAKVVISCFAFCIGSVSAAPCYNNSWIEIPSTGVLNGIFISAASNASDCQARCLATSNCSGVSWDTTNATAPRCYFNYATTNSSSSNSSGINYLKPNAPTTYYSLLRGTPSCSNQDGNCSYMWIGQRDIHAFSGVDGNRSNINDCIKLCQMTPNCTGVDWNQQDANCWINANNPVSTGFQPNITYFRKNCNDVLSTSARPPTPGPTSTPLTSTTSISLPSTSTATTFTPRYTPPANNGPSNLAMMDTEFAHYPQAIKPAYIVLAGLGAGCILLVITAIVTLCLYPLQRNKKYSTNSTLTTVHTHQPHSADNNYVESDEPDRIDMDDMAEGEVKTYYNAEEAN